MTTQRGWAPNTYGPAQCVVRAGRGAATCTSMEAPPGAPLQHEGPVRVVVCGPAGSGKTCLIVARAQPPAATLLRVASAATLCARRGEPARAATAETVPAGASSHCRRRRRRCVQAAATETFPERVPPVLPPTRIACSALPDPVELLLVDTSSRIEDRAALQAGERDSATCPPPCCVTPQLVAASVEAFLRRAHFS